MTNEYAAAFGFAEWPFRIVADEALAHVWADRAEVRKSLETRLRRMSSLPTSSVQLLWADFGAGKSHTLRFIEQHCQAATQSTLIPVYNEIPVNLESLLDLYRIFAGASPDSLLDSAGRAVRGGRLQQPRSQGGRDLWQALRLIASQDFSLQSVGTEWFRAPPKSPNLNTLKANGISGRIEDETRVVEVAAELVRLHRSETSGALVWLIDEFQRTADLGARKRDGLSKAMVSLFNACSTGLHLVLSLSVAQQETALHLLPPDLQSRARTYPILTLPYLSQDDARQFCSDLFRSATEGAEQPDGWPLSPEALNHALTIIDKVSDGRVTPRRLMETLNGLFLEIHEKHNGKPPLLPVSGQEMSDAVASLGL